MLDALTAIYRTIASLVKNKVISTLGFDDVLILRSPISWSVKRTYLTMRLLGFKPRVMRSIPLFGFIGYTADGKLVEFDKESLRERPNVLESARENTAIKNEALAKRALFCENDGRFQNNANSFDVLPNIPAFAIQTGGTSRETGMYSFNIPLNFDFFPFRVPLAPGVHLETKESSSGDYVHIYGKEPEGRLSPLTIKRVQTALFAVAEQIALSSK